MKKVISLLLLVALCLGCFAGCAPKEDPALNSAAEYLYAMYKDAEAVTSNNYTVVSQVRINDVVYPITWTTDKADNVQIVAGDNNMTTIKITASTEDVNYKLTATLKNADGLETSVSFDHIIPAKAQIGGTIVLAYPKENKYITGSHYLYEAKNKWELNLSENKADAIALEVVENGDDTVTLKAGNMYLFCDATSVKFVSEQSDNTKFVLEAADTEGGYFIKCAVANYGGKAQYLEVYGGYLTCYGMGSDTSIYIFKLEDGTGANGTISGLDAAPAPEDTPTTNPPATNPPATNPPATNPPAVGGKVVLSYPKDNKFVTGTHSLYAAKNKWQLELTDSKADAIALEVINNSDNTVTFKAGNQYLFCDATHVKFVTEQSDNTKFVLETTDGGYFVKCAVANYGGKAQYLEVYSGILTCFGMGADPSIYVFKLEDGTGANGTISGLEETPAPDNTPSTSNPPAVTTGWTKVSSLNDGDKIVIVNPASNMALSMTKTGFYNNGVDVSSNFNSITDEEIFVVKKNSDGSVTLTSVSGKKVALAESYSSLNEEGVNDKWTVSDAGDGQGYLLNVGRELYLEWYASKNNWSAYNPGADNLNADYVLAFYKQA